MMSGLAIQSQSELSMQSTMLEPQESVKTDRVEKVEQYTLFQVATVIDDYFKKPKVESYAVSAAKQREKMAATSA